MKQKTHLNEGLVQKYATQLSSYRMRSGGDPAPKDNTLQTQQKSQHINQFIDEKVNK